MLVVIDTNIMVLALWSKAEVPARVVGPVLRGHLIPALFSGTTWTASVFTYVGP